MWLTLNERPQKSEALGDVMSDWVVNYGVFRSCFTFALPLPRSG